MSIKTRKNQRPLYINQKPLVRNNKNVAFKGSIPSNIASNTFNFLEKSEILGPLAVDLVSMTVPRSIVDFTRGPAAGIETTRREIVSTGNTFIPGVYAMGAGWLINKLTGLKQNLFIDSKTLDVLHTAWNGAKGNTEKYVKNVFENTTGFVGVKNNPVKSFSQKTVEDISKKTAKLIDSNLSGRALKKELAKITAEATKDLQANNNLSVSVGEKTVSTNMKRLVENTYEAGKEVFKKTKPEKLNNVINKIKKTSVSKSVLGLGTAVGISFAIQFVNRYLTKKKTGSSAFVGRPDYQNKVNQNSKEKDPKKDAKFKATRIASAAFMTYLTGAALVMSANPKKVASLVTKPKTLLNKIEFKSKLPSIDQLKIIFGTTMIGRMLAATDKNELRETNIRDMSGLFNWLVIGGFVSSLTAYGLAKKDEIGKLFNGKPMPKNTTIPQKISHIIGKITPKSLAEIDTLNLSEKAKKSLKNKKNIATAAGLIYSSLALGIFVPIINKQMTNKAVLKEMSKNKPESVNKQEKTKEYNQKKFNQNKILVEKTLGSLSKRTV